MKEQRIPFPDYSAHEQEIDAIRAERRKYTDVYMSKVDGIWQALIPDDHDIVINGKVGEELDKFCISVKEKMAEKFNLRPRFRCIKNSGVDEYLRKCQIISRRLNNGRD